MAEFDESKLSVGDLILNEYDTRQWHSTIYVGRGLCADRPYVDSTFSDTVDGVRVSSGKGLMKDFNEFLSKDSKTGKIEVFRCTDTGLALRAAKRAKEWAVNPHTSAPKTPYHDLRRFKQGPEFVSRLDATESHFDNKLTGASMFRIARAAVRASEGQPLSKTRGVSCQMFVIYCYQVAAFEGKYPGGLVTTRSKKKFAEFSAARSEAKSGLSKSKEHYRTNPLKKDNELFELLTRTNDSIFGDVSTLNTPNKMVSAYLKTMGAVKFGGHVLPKELKLDAKLTSIDDLRKSLKAKLNRGTFRELEQREFTK